MGRVGRQHLTEGNFAMKIAEHPRISQGVTQKPTGKGCRRGAKEFPRVYVAQYRFKLPPRCSTREVPDDNCSEPICERLSGPLPARTHPGIVALMAGLGRI